MDVASKKNSLYKVCFIIPPLSFWGLDCDAGTASRDSSRLKSHCVLRAARRSFSRADHAQ
jgi:hypothetical protein